MIFTRQEGVWEVSINSPNSLRDESFETIQCIRLIFKIILIWSLKTGLWCCNKVELDVD